jgi:LPLT family lysophospholipid transporter-like MFS transporter
MMFANSLKLLGAASICFGFNPFIGYTLVGIGAAAYSPAKYGILGELTTGDKLVKANGLMESSTIAAILLGSVAGGVLADWHVLAALGICAVVGGSGEPVYPETGRGKTRAILALYANDRQLL